MMTTILVLDDDPYVPLLIEAIVPREWIVRSAPNGLVGLDLLRQLSITPAGIDMIILDLQMPALDGYDTVVRLRQLVPHIPVLILTGLASAPDSHLERYAHELGCVLVHKSISPDALGHAIQAVYTQVPKIEATAILTQLQRKAREAEAHARQRVAIQVALFATDPLWIAGIGSLLSDEHILVAATAQSIEQLHAVCTRKRIDVLIIAWQDSHLVLSIQPSHQLPIVVAAPNYRAAQALRQIERIAGVVISTDAMAATTLGEAVQVVASGGHYWPTLQPSIADGALVVSAVQAQKLTPRERELLFLDKPGVPLEVLAQTFGVTPKTIEQYRWRIRDKLEKAAER
jgi:DNA-binding NarL/FixJ family response regulator